MWRVAVLFVFVLSQIHHGTLARSYHHKPTPIEYHISCTEHDNILINGKRIKCNAVISDDDADQVKIFMDQYKQGMSKVKNALEETLTDLKKMQHYLGLNDDKNIGIENLQKKIDGFDDSKSIDKKITLTKLNRTLLKIKNNNVNINGENKEHGGGVRISIDLVAELEENQPSARPLSRKNLISYVNRHVAEDVLLNSNGDLVSLLRPATHGSKKEIDGGGKEDVNVRYLHISNPEAIEEYRQKHSDSLTDDRCNCGVDLIHELPNRRNDGFGKGSDIFSGENSVVKTLDIDFINTKSREKKKPDKDWEAKPKDNYEPKPKKDDWNFKKNDNFYFKKKDDSNFKNSDDFSYTKRRRPEKTFDRDDSYQPAKKKSANSGWGQYKNLKIGPQSQTVYHDEPRPKRNRNRHLDSNLRSNYNPQFGRTPIPFVGKKRIYDELRIS